MSPFHHHGSSTKKITKVSSLSTLLLSIGCTVSPPLSCSPPINSQTALKLHMWVDSHTHTTQIDTGKKERHTPMKSFKALVVEKTQMLSESGDSFQVLSFPHVLSFNVCVIVCVSYPRQDQRREITGARGQWRPNKVIMKTQKSAVWPKSRK